MSDCGSYTTEGPQLWRAEGLSLLLRSDGTQFGQSCWTVDLNHRPDAGELK